MNELGTVDKVEQLEGECLKMEQVETPLTHRFAPGVYLREIFMPAGALVIGHKHKTEHFNIITKGEALVVMDGQKYLVTAGDTFVSQPGVRKVLYILEDMVWQTVHPIADQNAGSLSEGDQLKLVDELEPNLIIKSDTWKTAEKAKLEADAKLLTGTEVEL